MTRELAIRIISGEVLGTNEQTHEAVKMAIRSLESVRGEWIETTNGDHWKCSACGCRSPYWFEEENSCEWDLDMSEWHSNYCPNCGAEMRGNVND